MGKGFRNAFRMGSSGTRFSWKFSGQYYMFFLPFSPVSLTELCSFWYGLKDLFTLHKLAATSCP